MIEINWDPIPHLGPLPINWYGLTFLIGLIVGWLLVRRWVPRYGVSREHIDGLIGSIALGTVLGARLYFVLQNDLAGYVQAPWRFLAIWEGGLAYFGGLFGAIAAAFIYTRRHRLSFARVADLFAPAVPVGSAIGRIGCGLAGMDYGTPTAVPWGVVYTNAESYAPVDGISRHPTQFYELVGDLVIAAVLLRFRGRLPEGGLFVLYLMLFAILRFVLFFFRGDVPTLALGLTNGHWTALVVLACGIAAFASGRLRNVTSTSPAV
jgi:phosphatidylglycerol---prolipoprotein diacylglyceryl transferase